MRRERGAWIRAHGRDSRAKSTMAYESREQGTIASLTNANSARLRPSADTSTTNHAGSSCLIIYLVFGGVITGLTFAILLSHETGFMSDA